MTSVYLRFAGPYQSWAGARVTGNHVNTAPLPTRSGIIGLVAAALGARHGQWPEWLQELQVEVRVDNPGRIEKDFQTINPRPEAQEFIERVWSASGQKGKAPTSFTPDAQKGTSIVRRTYLAGAEFLVKISHPERTEQIAAALACPGFSPYLGRKAFAPAFPFLLGTGPDDLLTTAPSSQGGSVSVHILDGRDNAYADATATTVRAHDRHRWWSQNASIPARATP